MSIANAHHPQISDSWKVVVNNEGILVCFLLSRNESLSSFDSMRDHGTSWSRNSRLWCKHLGTLFLAFNIRHYVIFLNRQSWLGMSARKLIKATLLHRRCRIQFQISILPFLVLRKVHDILIDWLYITLLIGQIKFVTIPYLIQSLWRLCVIPFAALVIVKWIRINFLGIVFIEFQW